ncbi:hypothetical protein D3C72_2062980 [compost metagenome]
MSPLGLGRFRERDHARPAWVQVAADGMDRAALAGRVPALEQGDDALAGRLLPELQLDQLDLQLFQRLQVFFLAELLLVRVIVGGERGLVDPLRQFGIVDVEEPLLAVDVEFHRPAFGLRCRLL